MINKIKIYLKGVQESQIKSDLFRVFLGLFIVSFSYLIVLLMPEGFKDELNRAGMGINILFVMLGGIGITISGLIPIILRVIHKVLKTLWDSKWYVSITIPAFFMSLIISVVSLLDVNIPLLDVIAKFVFMFGIIWLSLYLIIKVAVIIHIEEEKKFIPEKKTKPKKSHRQINKVSRLNRKKGRD